MIGTILLAVECAFGMCLLAGWKRENHDKNRDER